MRIIVTGAAGFIGCNFVRYALRCHSDARIAAVDKLTYAGNLENLAGLDADGRMEFHRADIADAAEMAAVSDGFKPDSIVNFAAETHVDRSLSDAAPFIRTNVLGVQTLLDLCRTRGGIRLVQVSTDEIYGSIEGGGRFTESSPPAPNNPYAATKAAADFLARAAHVSHGSDVVVTRSSNNFGPYQFPEKLIPLTIANALEDKPIPVYGDGLHVRDWICVEDHCAAIDAALRRGKAGEIYNVGGNHDVPNMEVIKTVLRALGKPESLIRHVADRPGHDRRYATDDSKIGRCLDWRPARIFDDAIAETVKWYVDNPAWLAGVRSGEYKAYYDRMYGRRLSNASGGEAEERRP